MHPVKLHMTAAAGCSLQFFSRSLHERPLPAPIPCNDSVRQQVSALHPLQVLASCSSSTSASVCTSVHCRFTHLKAAALQQVSVWAITESVLALPCRHLDLTRCTGLSDQAWFALANYRHSHGGNVSAEAYSAIAQLDVAVKAGAEHSGSLRTVMTDSARSMVAGSAVAGSAAAGMAVRGDRSAAGHPVRCLPHGWALAGEASLQGVMRLPVCQGLLHSHPSPLADRLSSR